MLKNTFFEIFFGIFNIFYKNLFFIFWKGLVLQKMKQKCAGPPAQRNAPAAPGQARGRPLVHHDLYTFFH